MFCTHLERICAMDHLSSQSPILISFRQIYEQNIVPKLQQIDIFLKSSEAPYEVASVAHYLGMAIQDVLEIMTTYSIEYLDKLTFFNIIAHSTSYICSLIKRQWRYTMVSHYTPAMVAYIYELNEHKVSSAFLKLGKDTIGEDELTILFEHIPTSIFCFS